MGEGVRMQKILILLTILAIATTVMAGQKIKQGDTVRIVTPEVVARLCPYPSCGLDEHIPRIPVNTELKVEGINTIKHGMMKTAWFEVKYNNLRGWVSMYDTDAQ